MTRDDFAEACARAEHWFWIAEANLLEQRRRQAMGHATEALLRAERARGERPQQETNR